MSLKVRLNAIIIALLLGIVFFSSLKINALWYSIKQDEQLIEVSHTLDLIGNGLIDLSLERSVVQVTSALPDPIAPQFRKLLDDQRAKTNQAFEQASQMIESSSAFKRGDEFLQKFSEQRLRLKELRQKADLALSVPQHERDQAFVDSWPRVMPQLIEEMERGRFWMNQQSKNIPTYISILSEMRHHAWRIREFGGRERTYLAIATALQQPIDQRFFGTMEQQAAAVGRSIAQIRAYTESQNFSEKVLAQLANLEKIYFTDYVAEKNRLIDMSRQGQAPDVSFTDFFTESSNALEQAVILYRELTAEGQEYLSADIAKAYRDLFFTLALVVLLTLIALYLLWYINCRMFASLMRTQQAIDSLAKKNYQIDLPDSKRSDELGNLARSVDFFRSELLAADELRAEQERLKIKAEEDRREAIQKIADSFDQKVGGLLRSLSKSVNDVSHLADEMRKASEQTTEVTQTTAAAAVETESNVQVVAAATEELSASIGEIATQIESTARKVNETAASADQSRETIRTLSDLAEAIGGVIGSIRAIADQTNLLALNATIEAARAGDAGKGFAVVADEVKKLANETASRTDQISDQVTRIQQAVAQSVSTMEGIISRITDINQAANSVAAAVEEQNAATSEISRNVTQAALGTKQVSQTVETVKSNASLTGKSAQDVLSATRELQKFANDMNVEVKDFLDQMRA